jgi:hypothetical protein
MGAAGWLLMTRPSRIGGRVLVVVVVVVVVVDNAALLQANARGLVVGAASP